MLLGHTNPKISASVKLLKSGFVSNGQKSLVLHVASISTTIKTFKLLLCSWLNSLCKFIFFLRVKTHALASDESQGN